VDNPAAEHRITASGFEKIQNEETEKGFL